MLRPVTSPYRDENESLRAEIARLRAELDARRSPRLGPPIALAAAEFGAIVLLRPWLNGGSDLRFWIALGAVVGIAVTATALTIRR
jgi:hypothetical protein